MAKKTVSAPKHPDHSANLNRVRRIRGQVEGIERMIEERKYCPDILTQVQAVTAALKSLSANILNTHLHHCVKDAMNSNNPNETEKKIEEIIELFRKE